MLIKDQVVVVVGGAGLLGGEIVKAIASEGGIPIIADIDILSSEVLRNEIEISGKVAHALQLNITDQESIQYVIAASLKLAGKIDAVVNCAYPRGKSWGTAFEELSFEDFCENINLHLGGYFLVSKEFAEYFKRQGRGNIVNLGSIYGTMAPKFEIYADVSFGMPVEYAAIKAAIVQMTKYFAQYYKGHGLRANVLSPGGINDSQDPIFVKAYGKHSASGGLLDRKEVADALVLLLSEKSAAITGQNIIVDEGFSL